MPRGKRINIEMEIEDEYLDKFRNINTDVIKKSRNKVEESLSNSVRNVFDSARKLYKEKANEDEIQKSNLYSVQDAYDYLKGKGVYISFRAFGGRIERGNIPFVKIGRKRYLPQQVLDDMLSLNSSFYTVKEAFEEY